MGQYLLKKTIQKHYDSINALAFSHDGSLFASAADDGLIIIFQANGSGREVRRFQVKAPVTTLLWRSRFGNTLVAGDTSGDVHTICLDGSTSVSVTHNWTWSTRTFHLQGNTYYHTINCVPGPIHCIVENGIWLAIGLGKVIQLVKQATIGAVSWLPGNYANPKQFTATWERTRLLPDPPKFPELEGELPEPIVHSLHFLGGGNVLLVTYMDHGVM